MRNFIYFILFMHIFETVSCYVAKAGMELVILLSRPWVLELQALGIHIWLLIFFFAMLEVEPRALHMPADTLPLNYILSLILIF
jgi:hypothetical protein